MTRSKFLQWLSLTALGRHHHMATNAELEARIAALEAKIGAPTEANTPNYLSVTPKGQVAAEFTGGVQLVEGTGPSPAPSESSSLVWLDPTGAAYAAIEEYKLAAEHVLELTVAGKNLLAGGLFPDIATLQILAAVGFAALNTEIDGSLKTIIDSTGYSDWCQKANNLSELPSKVVSRQNLGFSWGSVAVGVGMQEAGSNDWSVIGNATGASQIQLGTTYCFTLATFGGPRDTANQSITVQASQDVNPIISAWLNSSLLSGLIVTFLAIHD